MRDRLGMNDHLANDRRAWQAAHTLGAAWGRIDLNWDTVQPKSRDDAEWEVIDLAVDGARAYGIQVYASLAYTPGWANNERGRGNPPTLITDWMNFVQKAAGRYQGRIAAWGVWNEFRGSVEEYVQYLFRPARSALKAVDKDAVVCGPELETERDWPGWLREFLRLCGEDVDVITTHCYDSRSGRAVWDKLTRHRSWFEQTFLRRAPSIQQVIEEAGYGEKPWWVTETGFQTDEQAQARYIQEILERLEGAQKPDGICFFQLLDDLNYRGGFFRQDFSPKPVVEVMQRYAGVPVV